MIFTEVAELVSFIIIEGLEYVITSLIKAGIKYVIKKVVDSFGNVVTQIVYYYDSDGDGVDDSEQVVYTLDTLIPSLDDGYCLCNKGDKIGLGIPQYQVIDGFDIADFISSDIVTGNDNGFIVDFDFDGENDDVLVPLPDFTGDGQNDWGWLVDDDDNGLPDVSPYSPFYPVGSEGYHEIVERVSPADDYTIMTKPISEYTVTEGILLIFLIVGAFKLVGKAFRRKKVVKYYG